MEVNTGDMSLYDSIDAFADAIMNMEEENDTNIKLTESTNISLPPNMVSDFETDENRKTSGTCNDLDDIDVDMQAFDDPIKDSDNDSNSVNNMISNELGLEKVAEINTNEVSNIEGKESRHLEDDSSNVEKDRHISDRDDAQQSSECDESSRESDRLEENPSRCTNGDLEEKSNDDDSTQEFITPDKNRIENLTEIDKDIKNTEKYIGNSVNKCKVCEKCEVENSDVEDNELGEDKDKCVHCNCKYNKDTERQNTTTESDKDKSKEDTTNCFQEKESQDIFQSDKTPESSKTKIKAGTADAIKQDLDEENNTKSKSKVQEDKSDDETKKENDDKTEDEAEDDDVVELPQPPVKCFSVDSEDSEGLAESNNSNTAAPVFVEIGVETILGRNAPSPPESPNDCMMIVENVQVDIDPSMLMMPDEDDEYGQREDSDDDDLEACEVVPKKPEEPVSLLTSSDDDDVILQEPHIDTVDVSDETDEDDVPLTRLLKPPDQAGGKPRDKTVEKKKKKKMDKALSDIFWGKNNEVYCYLCKFVTKQRAALVLHMAEEHAGSENPNHTTNTIQVCSQCNFQSGSKSQFFRHMRKHKAEKCFKCALCDYRAKHKMSLVYHMKSHRELATYKCKKCPFRANSKTLIQKHLKVHSSGGVLHCSQCEFTHRTAEALKLHVRRKHSERTRSSARAARSRRPRDDDDDEYLPGKKM